MAIVDLLGEIEGATCEADWDCTHRRFEPVLADLLPRGPAWPRDGEVLRQLVAAEATELSRVDLRGLKLLAELDPSTTWELLEAWEKMYGLPDCPDAAPTTIEGRRAALLAKLLRQPGFDQSPGAWKALLLILEYVLFWVLKGFSPFACGDPCNAIIYDDDWQFLWQLGVVSGDNDPMLECVVEHVARIHTIAHLHYMWTPVEVLPATKSVRGVASNVKGYTVAVGTSSLVLSASPDNQTWSEVTPPVAEDYLGVCSVDDVFVAVGVPGAMYSIDNGTTWLASTLVGGEVYAVSRSHNADGVVVAVGEDGRIYRSTDYGATFAELVSPTSEWLQGVTRCQGAMVAVGANGTALRSTNTTVWSAVSSGVTERLWGVSAWGLVVVAVGEDGRIIRSVDAGATWTTVTSPTSSRLYSVTSSPTGHWSACGVGGVIIQSTDDGVTWTLHESPTTVDLYAAGIDWPNGQAILGGDSRTIILE